MKKYVGFGDYLVRLSPPGYERFIQAQQFNVFYTGAEANVCASLAMLGMSAEFVTRLPLNDIALAGEAHLRRFGVETSHIAHGGDRIGVFYIEKGASQRPSKVIYDRMNTAITEAKPGDFNWSEILRGADFFHITGITPALGGALPEICREACERARALGVFTSCDLNYRRLLWTPEQAKRTMESLLPNIDLLIANEEDADKILGIRSENTDVESGTLNAEGYAEVAREIERRYGVARVGITMRESISASQNGWSAMLYSGGNAYYSRRYDIQIVDRVGAGDSFAAGLLYSLGSGFNPQKAVDFAAAASCLKHSVEQDFNLVTADEVARLAEGDASGRIKR